MELQWRLPSVAHCRLEPDITNDEGIKIIFRFTDKVAGNMTAIIT